MKQDRLGRVRTSAGRRAELLAEYGRTSMSAAEFADYVGVKYTTFVTWLTKAKKNGRPKLEGAEDPVPALESPPPVQWVEACVEGLGSSLPKGGKPLVVQLPSGVRLEIGDSGQAALAAELIRALEPTPGRTGRC